MQSETPMTVQSPAAQTLAVGQNRVLRNTYMLLALSMLPTVAGAWLGIELGFTFFAANRGWFECHFLVTVPTYPCAHMCKGDEHPSAQI